MSFFTIAGLWLAGLAVTLALLRSFHRVPRLMRLQWEAGFYLLAVGSLADIASTWWALEHFNGVAEVIPLTAQMMHWFGVLPGLLIQNAVILCALYAAGRHWGRHYRLRNFLYVAALVRIVLASINAGQIVAAT